jgi:hypothetical protein
MVLQVRFTARDDERLRRHVLDGAGREAVAFLFAGPNVGPHGLTLTVREIWPLPEEALVAGPLHGVAVRPDYVRGALWHARETGLSLLEAHGHPGAGAGVTFSAVDRESDARKFPYVAARVPGIHLGTMV